MKIRCPHCRKISEKRDCDVARARAAGLNIYCDRRCSGLGRRDGRTKAERREAKRLYDMEYRKTSPTLKARRQAFYKRTYDPMKAAVERKKRAGAHVEYCRRPEYRRWKKTYDRKHRAKKFYGPFAEVAMLTNDLNLEIKGRKTNDQVKYENGRTNLSQRREREAGQGPSRNRHQTANS